MDDAKFTGNTGLAEISLANATLDGTGSGVVKVFEPNSSLSGAMINSIRIKSIQKCTPGMIRFFIGNGDLKFLFLEVRVFGTDPSNISPSFSRFIQFPRGSMLLQPTSQLWATTQVSEKFHIIVDGNDWYY